MVETIEAPSRFVPFSKEGRASLTIMSKAWLSVKPSRSAIGLRRSLTSVDNLIRALLICSAVLLIKVTLSNIKVSLRAFLMEL